MIPEVKNLQNSDERFPIVCQVKTMLMVEGVQASHRFSLEIRHA